MAATVQERLALLEAALRRVEERLERLDDSVGVESRPVPHHVPIEGGPEEHVQVPPALSSEPEPAPVLAPTTPPTQVERGARPVTPGLSLEDLLAGRLFAWVGGLAVVLAAAFFVVTAVRRGWIDETTRIALAFAGSAVLVVAGVLLHELKGQTQAARALVASGVAAAYLTLVAATQVYHLVDPVPSFAVAGVVACAAMAIAVRWRSPLVAGLGIGGALLAPVLVASGTSLAAVAFMAVALVGSVGVLVWCAWTWLSVMTFVLTVPQLLEWVFASEPEPRLWVVLVVLALFWVLYLGAAAGFELRVPTARVRVSSSILVGLAAALVTSAGWAVLDERDHPDGATAWVLAFAAVHVAIGMASRRSARVNPALGAAVITLGLGFSAVGFALALDGPALVIGWCAEAVGLAIVGWRRREPRVSDAALGFLALAVGHTLVFEAPPEGVVTGPVDVGEAVFALAGVVVASVALALLRPAADPWVRRLLRRQSAISLRMELLALALAGLLYLLAYAFDGVPLVAAWAAVAVALAAMGTVARDRLVFGAALVTVALAIAHVLVFEAPPRALFLGVDDLGNAVLAITAVIVATAALAALAPPEAELFRGFSGRATGVRARWLLVAVVAIALVYLASIVVVDRWGVTESGERREAGQFALSLLWGAVGLTALVLGLVRDIAALRQGGLVLLVLAVAKVFVYDLSALTSLARVASLLVIGLLLIAGAYFYQRMRHGPAQGDGGRP